MMRVIRWKNASTGVESLNITATGIYFPVGKTDSSFIARYSMISAGQSASVERVSSPLGDRIGSPAINVSGTTEVVVNERRGLSTGIIVTAISGTLISVLDDNTPITNFPDVGLGRFPAKEDADAYVYGSTVPQGIPAIINGVPYSWGGAWVLIALNETEYDLIVYGATAHGISAAISAKRAGLSVIILNPDTHIGGMTTGGIAATDYAATGPWTTDIIPGIAGDLLARMSQKMYPQAPTYNVAKDTRYWLPLWTARSAIGDILQENGILVVNSAFLLGVESVNDSFSGYPTKRVMALKTTAGTFKCRAGVHDGTDEGDLIAAAGLSYSIGRDSTTAYNETGAGITATQAFPEIDPYVIPGDSSSGILFGFESTGPSGGVGSADLRVQAMQFRLAFSAVDPHHQIEPESYDPLMYEYFGRKAAASGSSWTTISDVLTLYPIPGTNIVDINQKTEFSIGWVGPESTEWITATKDRRDQIRETVKQWTLGFLKFLKTDIRIPIAVRNSVASYGFTDSDFHDNGGFPPFIYCREGRRLLGDFVLTANDLIIDNDYADPAAFAYYAMDSHNVRRYVSGGVPTVEGAVFNETTVVGARVPMRVCLPKASECSNLTASAALSVSRMAYLTLRMEPVRIAVAEFAGAIHSIAFRKNKAVQSVTWQEAVPLTGIGRHFPQKSGDVLMFADRSRPYTPSGITETGGTWALSAKAMYGQISRHAASLAIGSAIRFSPTIRVTGAYRVRVQYPVVPTAINSTRAIAAPVVISHAGGTTNLILNQSGVNASDCGAWVDLGTYVMRRGSTYGTGTASDLSPDYVEFGTDGSGTKATWITAVAFEKISE